MAMIMNKKKKYIVFISIIITIIIAIMLLYTVAIPMYTEYDDNKIIVKSKLYSPCYDITKEDNKIIVEQYATDEKIPEIENIYEFEDNILIKSTTRFICQSKSYAKEIYNNLNLSNKDNLMNITIDKNIVTSIVEKEGISTFEFDKTSMEFNELYEYLEEYYSDFGYEKVENSVNIY